MHNNIVEASSIPCIEPSSSDALIAALNPIIVGGSLLQGVLAGSSRGLGFHLSVPSCESRFAEFEGQVATARHAHSQKSRSCTWQYHRCTVVCTFNEYTRLCKVHSSDLYRNQSYRELSVATMPEELPDEPLKTPNLAF